MPQFSTITGTAQGVQTLQSDNKTQLMQNIALIKVPDSKGFSLFLKHQSLDPPPLKTQFIILRDVAINSMPIFEWLRYHHDDAKDIFECFATAFEVELLPVGSFSISIDQRPTLLPSFATCKLNCTPEDYFVQDNLNAKQIRGFGYTYKIN